MPRGYTNPNRAQIIAAMDGTRTAQEIAEQFGIPRASVYSTYLDQHARGVAVALKPIPRGRRGTTRIAQLVALADGTRTRAQIAEAMGIDLNNLAGYEGRARNAGHVLRTLPKLRKTGEYGPRLDPAHAIVADLSEPIREWLIAQVPDGGTIADLLRAFVVDAYHDEVDA